MRRAVGLVAIVVSAAVAVPCVSAAAPPSPADLEAELVCPTCQTTLDQSDAPVARRMKLYIRERLAAGASAAEIKSELVDQFGPSVLAEPPKRGFDLLAWLLPLAFGVVGVVVVALLAWTWSRRRAVTDGDPPAPLDAADERRLDEELARFEP